LKDVSIKLMLFGGYIYVKNSTSEFISVYNFYDILC